MKPLRAMRLLMTGFTTWTLIAPPPLTAQQAVPSLPFSDSPVDTLEAERILAERFGRSANPLLMERTLRRILDNPEYYGLTPEQLKKMMPDIRKRPEDFGIDPLDQRWRERFRNMPAPQPNPMGGVNPPVPAGPIPPERPEPMPPGRPPPVGGDPGRPQPPGVEPPRPQPGNGGGNRPGGPKTGGNSGRIQDMMRDLIGANSNMRDWARDLTFEARRFARNAMPRLNGFRFDGITRALGNLMPRGLKAPSFSGLSMPSVGGSLPNLSMPSGGSLGNGLLVVVIIVLAGIAIWFVARLVRKWIPAELLARWRLGPWPVQPDAVSSRGELVQAFEYLALLKLGQSASAAHHKSIANRLAAPQNDALTANRAMAAEELGELYEQARYAPPDEELSPHQLAASRTDLCLLAGVSAA